jgi:hypothetical protein
MVPLFLFCIKDEDVVYQPDGVYRRPYSLSGRSSARRPRLCRPFDCRRERQPIFANNVRQSINFGPHHAPPPAFSPVAVGSSLKNQDACVGPVTHSTTTGGIRTGSVRHCIQSSGIILPCRIALLNFAHSGSVKKLVPDDHEKPFAFCMSCLYPSSPINVYP